MTFCGNLIALKNIDQQATKNLTTKDNNGNQL